WRFNHGPESTIHCWVFFFFQAEDGIRDFHVTGVQTCSSDLFFRHQALMYAICSGRSTMFFFDWLVNSRFTLKRRYRSLSIFLFTLVSEIGPSSSLLESCTIS